MRLSFRFVLPPECNFQRETKIEPDLRLLNKMRYMGGAAAGGL